MVEENSNQPGKPIHPAKPGSYEQKFYFFTKKKKGSADTKYKKNKKKGIKSSYRISREIENRVELWSTSLHFMSEKMA